MAGLYDDEEVDGISPLSSETPPVRQQPSRLRSKSVAEGSLSMYKNFTTLYASTKSKVSLCKNLSNEQVVLKAYTIAELSDSEVLKVRREMRFLLSSLTSHPHIVRGIAAFQDVTALYLVQEYAAQGDLFDVASRFPKRQLPEKSVCDQVIFPMSQAIAFLHANGIMHRDIKPENVVVMADGTAKLCDFGLAIDFNNEAPVSRVGTLEYMAPEIVRLKAMRESELNALRRNNTGQYTEKVDVWALGCLAFELLIGHSPFLPYSDAQTDEIESAILAGVPVFGSRPPTIGDAAMDYIRATLDREVGSRPSAEELLEMEWMQSATPNGGEAEKAARRNAQRTMSLPPLPPQRHRAMLSAGGGSGTGSGSGGGAEKMSEAAMIAMRVAEAASAVDGHKAGSPKGGILCRSTGSVAQVYAPVKHSAAPPVATKLAGRSRFSMQPTAPSGAAVFEAQLQAMHSGAPPSKSSGSSKLPPLSPAPAAALDAHPLSPGAEKPSVPDNNWRRRGLFGRAAAK